MAPLPLSAQRPDFRESHKERGRLRGRSMEGLTNLYWKKWTFLLLLVTESTRHHCGYLFDLLDSELVV